MRAERIGVAGGSNFSFLLERGDDRYVLRRPPRPPLPPSAHDMVREARLQLALAKQGIRVPPIVAVGEDESVLGVPFYVMEFVEGTVVLDELPPQLDERARRDAPSGSTSSTTSPRSTQSTSTRPTCSRSCGRAATSSARCAAGSSSGT